MADHQPDDVDVEMPPAADGGEGGESQSQSQSQEELVLDETQPPPGADESQFAVLVVVPPIPPLQL